MAKRKKVFNHAESEKASAIKGSVRACVKLDAITAQCRVHVDRKKEARKGGKMKHKGRAFDSVFYFCRVA